MRSDAELLAAAGGDPSAFRKLYDRYAVRVHGYHLRRCGDDHAALDLTAETFAQSWLSRGRFDDREPDEHWLEGLDEALAGLTDDQRRELRVVDGLEYDRAAEDSGMTPQAARARVTRGLAALRHRFTDSQGA